MRAWADVAHLSKTRSLDGSFVVQCTAGLPFFMEEGMEVALVPPQEDMPRRVTVDSAEDIDGRTGCVRFAEVHDVETARALIGLHCLVRRELVPESAKLSGPSVVGWSVCDVSEGLLGTLSGIVEKPGQSLVEVERPDGQLLLIPLVDDFIVDIDEESRTITFDLPAGLTDL